MNRRLNLTIPVLNEELAVRDCVEKLSALCAARLPDLDCVIVVVDNGSTDRTGEIVRSLADADSRVRYLRLAARGKGLAIRAGWEAFPADVYAFMDVDLSTDIAAFPQLVATALSTGGIAVGSRFLPQSQVRRSLLRRITSFGYSLFQRLVLRTGIRDLPCGFKAAAAPVVAAILPQTKDNGWFFDSEFVVRAERAGFPVREIPVAWTEDTYAGRKSRVPVGPLIVRYVKSVLRLRRELSATGPAPSVAAPRVAPDEWRFVWLVALVAAVLTSLPPLFGWYVGHANGLVWKGAQFFSPMDASVYFSHIRQAATGHWLFEIYFTNEPLVRRPDLFWLIVGRCAGWFRLAPVVAYHLARVLLIPALAAAAYVLMSRFLDKRLRQPALLLFMFGSGVGPYVLPFVYENYQTNLGKYEVPIDLWASEANAFTSMLFSPHFVASLALFLVVINLLLKSFETNRRRPAIWAGLVGLYLFSHHPFGAPPLYCILLAWLVLRLAQRRLTWRHFSSVALFGLISAPAVAFYAYLTKVDSLGRSLASSNLCLTPAIWHVLLGLGIIVLAAPFGWWLMRRRDAAHAMIWDFLAVWVVVQLITIYLPFEFQRRFIEGVQFPLVVLAVPAIDELLRRWRTSRWRVFLPQSKVALALIAALLFLPSFCMALTRNMGVYAFGRSALNFQTPATVNALAWVRENTPPTARFMAPQDASHDLVGWADRRVFGGHFNETLDYFNKRDVTLVFFSPLSAGNRFRFACEQGIAYVWCGPDDLMKGITCPDERGFERVYDRDGVSIYRVGDCGANR